MNIKSVSIKKLPYGLHGLFERGYEAHIVFVEPQERPNFGFGWGLGNFGKCVWYTGLEPREMAGRLKPFASVIAIYDGKPDFSAVQTRV